MKKIREFILLFFCLSIGLISSSVYGERKVNITETNEGYSVFVNSEGCEIVTSEDKYGNFHLITVAEGFDENTGTGLPKLPNKVFTLQGEFEAEVVEAFYDTLKGIDIRPQDRLLMIGPDIYDSQEELIFAEAYKKNEFWPASEIISKRAGIFRGVSVSTFKITPFRYNPVSKILLKAKSLNLKLKRVDSPLNRAALSNPVVANILSSDDPLRVQPSNYENSGRAGKIVIFTIDSLLPEVERLARWQKLKGYDVVVESKPGQYPKSEVISKIDSELTNSDAVSKYMLIFGNSKCVEEYEVKWFYFNSIGNLQNISCSRYTDTEGDDHLADISLGVVPVNNLKEAKICVDKFIKYETDPVREADFYNNILGAAQSGFSHKVVDKTMDHMEDKGYTVGQRYYFNEDKAAMCQRMNDGVIIAAQYDHGYRGGWATPEFTGNEINVMTNGDKLPYMYSINCLSGSWDYGNGMNVWNPKATYEPDFYGLTERFLFKENGGGIGAFGATNITYTGINDTIFYGLFTAMWPADNSKTPLYRTGDIADYAMFYMHEQNDGHTGNHSISNFCDYHFMLYHNLCDPTLQLRSKAPVEVTATSKEKINEGDREFKISAINLDDGTAVLYNENTDKVIGRARISNGNADLSFQGGFSNGDTITLVVNGINCVPLFRTMVVGEVTSVLKDQAIKLSTLQIVKNGFIITNERDHLILVELWSPQGKKVSLNKVEAQKSVFVNKKDLSLATGTYFLKIKAGNKVNTHKIVLTDF